MADCHRCEGTQLIATWGGKEGEGGKIGPCPACNRLAAARFCLRLAHETFGDSRERAFDRAFTQGGNEHG